MLFQLDAWAVGLTFLAGMLASWFLGRRSGRRDPPESGNDPALKFTDASMAILGLLLAFSFAITLGRHDYRRLMVVGESNAIGDFYTCASLLKDPHRSALQALLRAYTQAQIGSITRFQPESEQIQITRRSLEMQARMTDLVSVAVADGTPIAVSLTNTLNEVTSANASRLAAYEAVLPWSIQALLLLAACVPSFLTGRIQGASSKTRLSDTFSFILLISLAIYVVLDLNQGRRGLIQVSARSFDRLLQSMQNFQ